MHYRALGAQAAIAAGVNLKERQRGFTESARRIALRVADVVLAIGEMLDARQLLWELSSG